MRGDGTNAREVTNSMTRRQFVGSTAGAAAAAAAMAYAPRVYAAGDRPAVLGGKPVHSGPWPEWPYTQENDQRALAEVLRSGNWYRYRGTPSTVDEFESRWAKALGTRYCQATSSGTSALITAVGSLGIGPGDEVLLSPYTFIATVNCVLLHHALPVFVDSDPATAQMDAAQIEARVNGDTRCIMPVHFGGASCDMDRVMEVARRRGLHVIEDSCQSHTAEWNGRRLGTIGDAGCYSFQNSKNLTSGEGGAMVTDDESLYHRAQAFHTNGLGQFAHDGGSTSNGANMRMTQFQGALLVEQLDRLEEQSRRREAQAAYLDKLLGEIEGVAPKRKLAGTTRHGYHLYTFGYDPAAFAGMDKSTFQRALAAEGVPVSTGYDAINKQPWVEQFLTARGFKRIYGEKRLKQWRDENHLPGNDRLIETAFWMGQTMLLGERRDMEHIAEAILRIGRHAAEIVKSVQTAG